MLQFHSLVYRYTKIVHQHMEGKKASVSLGLPLLRHFSVTPHMEWMLEKHVSGRKMCVVSAVGTCQDMPQSQRMSLESYSQISILDTFLQNMRYVKISKYKEKWEWDIKIKTQIFFKQLAHIPTEEEKINKLRRMCLFLWSYPWHVEVPGPRIKPKPQQ